ncbi:MAG: chitinase, partial [Lachnospiraceae bacterium]|nr:chitinase [Lachnospiraceae bacterium]
INGVPFYTRVWKTEAGNLSSDTMSMNGAAEFLSRNGLTPVWDDETCQNYAEMESGGVRYQVWMEDKESLDAKFSVMDSLGIKGCAAWKLGLENTAAWQAILQYER